MLIKNYEHVVIHDVALHNLRIFAKTAQQASVSCLSLRTVPSCMA